MKYRKIGKIVHLTGVDFFFIVIFFLYIKIILYLKHLK